MDPARVIKDALEVFFTDEATEAVLHVDDDFMPVTGSPVLLVADDGGSPVSGGPWLAGRDLMRVTIRLTVFAAGRTEARDTLAAAIGHLLAERPAGIARIENVPPVLDARDRATGAALASITMPVVVRPATATP